MSTLRATAIVAVAVVVVVSGLIGGSSLASPTTAAASGSFPDSIGAERAAATATAAIGQTDRAQATVENEDNLPQLTLTEATVAIQAGDQHTVSATYRFDVEESEPAATAPSEIEGTMWRFPDHEVTDLSVWVNGESVEPEMNRESRHDALTVPVTALDDGSVTVEMEYVVAGPTGELRVPLWAPEFTTSGDDRAIEITVELPPGTHVQGTVFPAVDSRADGDRLLEYRLFHVPGFVSVPYGEEPAGLTVPDLTRWGALLLISGLFAGWLILERRFRNREGGR